MWINKQTNKNLAPLIYIYIYIYYLYNYLRFKSRKIRFKTYKKS